MNRRSVIRCILGLAVAPKILAEIDYNTLRHERFKQSIEWGHVAMMDETMAAQFKMWQLLSYTKPVGMFINIES